MAGTKAGAAKAAKTNMERHGKDYYKRIGQIGGRKGHTGGFTADPELARRAGAKGGRISRRKDATTPCTYEITYRDDDEIKTANVINTNMAKARQAFLDRECTATDKELTNSDIIKVTMLELA